MSKIARYIGIDIHRHYAMIGGVDAQHNIVMQPRKVALNRFGRWVADHLNPNDRVVMEATTNVWVLHDLVQPHVDQVVVVHPAHVKVIATSLVKTDKRDTLALAKLLASNLTPEVWVPPPHVRQLRSLIKHRHHLSKQRTAAKNRLQGVLFRYNLSKPSGDPYSQNNREWWRQLPIDSVEKLRVRQDLSAIDFTSQQIREVELELAQLSINDDWGQMTPFLIQLPGVALVSAMTILSAIGNITRFPSAKKLVGYAGLGARVHASGKTYHTGGITKQGRSELRTVMVECAWSAVRYSEQWGRVYRSLLTRMEKSKAIVVIARKMLVVVWHVLSKQEADRHADPDAVERAFLSWYSRHSLARISGFRRSDFLEKMMGIVGLPLHSEATASL